MVVAFLRHLEFCQEILEAEVSLISNKHFRCDCGSVEKFFFFPALVNEERPSEVIGTPSYKCGWTLQCSQPYQFLSPQFLHVLLLRLAFSFALAPDNAHEFRVSPVLERRCFVWKNGICWLSRKGVETMAEVIEQNTAVFLMISCLQGREMECIEHRGQVIKCILKTKEELCPVVTMKEFMIHLSCLVSPVITNSLQLFSLSELVEALLENEPVLVSQPGKEMININQLLYFEPYACFNAELLRELLTGFDKFVSMTFLDEVSKSSCMKLGQLRQALGIDNTKLQAALASVPAFQQDQPEYQCKMMFQVWKESSQNPTHGSLRSALDVYSVFCGRNPMDLAGAVGQNAECVAGATVSLDQPTVQPDFHYDDNELSSDGIGSDSLPPLRTDRPELYQLHKFKGWEGKTLKVIEQVAPRWEQLAYALHFSQAIVEAIDHDNRKCEQACMDMFRRWLDGTARQPVSWETLMVALKDCNLMN